MQDKIKELLSIDNLIKLFGLILLVMVIVCGYSKVISNKNNQMVQVDLLKITNDYMAKATSLVLQVDPNVSEQNKMAKAQNIMKIVGSSVESLLDEYSRVNHVLIVQKQMLASDAGSPLIDITEKIEAQIDGKLNQQNLLNAAK